MVIILIIAFMILGNGGAEALGIAHLMPWYEEPASSAPKYVSAEAGNESLRAIHPAVEFEEKTRPVTEGYQRASAAELPIQQTVPAPVKERKDYSYAHGYYYQFLTGNERLVYDELIEALENFALETNITHVSETEYQNAYSAVYNDHPEFFWLNDGTAHWKNNEEKYYRIRFCLPAKAKETMDALNACADSIVQKTRGLHPYNAYFAIYEAVSGIATYGYQSGVDDQSVDLRE